MEIKIKISNFEGPLDLLLHLVEKKKMNIQEINISEIIEEYLKYIEEMRSEDLSIKVEFLVMATELLEIKSMSILNKKEKEEKEENLERKILEYKKFKDLAEKISEMENEYNICYTKDGKEIKKIQTDEIDMSNLTMERIFLEYKKFLRKYKEVMEIDIESDYPLELGIGEIKDMISKYENLTFHRILGNNFNRVRIVTIFLAILELYKLNEIRISDSKEFTISRG